MVSHDLPDDEELSDQWFRPQEECRLIESSSEGPQEPSSLGPTQSGSFHLKISGGWSPSLCWTAVTGQRRPCVSGDFTGSSSDRRAELSSEGSPYDFFPVVQVQPNEASQHI